MARTIRRNPSRKDRRQAERAFEFEQGPWFVPTVLRVPTEQVTLNTWTVRVNGVDLVDIEHDSRDVPALRRLIENAECWGRDDACHAVWVSIGRTANMRGVLLDLIDAEKAGV